MHALLQACVLGVNELTRRGATLGIGRARYAAVGAQRSVWGCRLRGQIVHGIVLVGGGLRGLIGWIGKERTSVSKNFQSIFRFATAHEVFGIEYKNTLFVSHFILIMFCGAQNKCQLLLTL